MITVKIKNKRDKEIIADNIDDAMYKLAEEKKNGGISNSEKMRSFAEYVKKHRTIVERYIPTTREERNAR